MRLEVINADAIQVYEGLPIATAKVSEAEMQGVPHHFLGIISPTESITVNQFHERVHAKIRELFARPSCNGVVIVGGTSYFIEGLLFKNQLVGSLIGEVEVREGASASASAGSCASGGSESKPHTEPELCNAELYRRLVELDPAAAAHLHPNNRRKVQRAVQIIEALPPGPERSLSALHWRQAEVQSPSVCTRSAAGSSGTSASASTSVEEQTGNPLLHYPNSLVIHVAVQTDEFLGLEERISKRFDIKSSAPFAAVETHVLILLDMLLCCVVEFRVDQMIDCGLEAEVRDFYRLQYAPLAASGCGADVLERGIFQSIGFKEFLGFIRGEESLPVGVSRLKTATVRYAKRQVKWLRNRLFPQCARMGIAVLDISSSGLRRVGSDGIGDAVSLLLSHAGAVLPWLQRSGAAEVKEGDPVAITGEDKEELRIAMQSVEGMDVQLNGTQARERHAVLKRRLFTVSLGVVFTIILLC